MNKIIYSILKLTLLLHTFSCNQQPSEADKKKEELIDVSQKQIIRDSEEKKYDLQIDQCYVYSTSSCVKPAYGYFKSYGHFQGKGSYSFGIATGSGPWANKREGYGTFYGFGSFWGYGSVYANQTFSGNSLFGGMGIFSNHFFSNAMGSFSGAGSYWGSMMNGCNSSSQNSYNLVGYSSETGSNQPIISIRNLSTYNLMLASPRYTIQVNTEAYYSNSKDGCSAEFTHLDFQNEADKKINGVITCENMIAKQEEKSHTGNYKISCTNFLDTPPKNIINQIELSKGQYFDCTENIVIEDVHCNKIEREIILSQYLPLGFRFSFFLNSEEDLAQIFDLPILNPYFESTNNDFIHSSINAFYLDNRGPWMNTEGNSLLSNNKACGVKLDSENLDDIDSGVIGCELTKFKNFNDGIEQFSTINSCITFSCKK